MMMPFRSFVALICVAGLTACGGGGGPVQIDPPEDFEDQQQDEIQRDANENNSPAERADPEDPFEVFGTEAPEDVQTEGSALEETLTEAEEATIVLTGVAIVVDDVTGERVIVRREGVAADDGSRTLGGVSLDLTDDVAGAFVVTSSFVQESIGAVGVVGVATELADMPTEGTATFTGGAIGFVITGDSGVRLSNGQSTVTANFASGLVDVDLDNFSGVSQVSGNVVDTPFDSLNLSDAAIVDGGFSGGTLTSTGDASVAEVIGANATVQAEGQFYGIDDVTSDPAEVGGLIHAQGDTGQIFTSFIAD